MKKHLPEWSNPLDFWSMFWARMKYIEVISSLPGSPYFFFKKNGPVKHSNGHVSPGQVWRCVVCRDCGVWDCGYLQQAVLQEGSPCTLELSVIHFVYVTSMALCTEGLAVNMFFIVLVKNYI